MTKEEIEFLKRGQKLGFRIIEDKGIKKVEINLHNPINLEEDFDLPSKFSHLIHYNIEPLTDEELEEFKNLDSTQLYDFFEDEKVIIGENNV